MDLRFLVKKNNETGGRVLHSKASLRRLEPHTIGGNPHVTSTAKTARVRDNFIKACERDG